MRSTIERIREKLNNMLESQSLNAKEVLALSEQLDQLIAEYYKKTELNSVILSH